MTDARLPGSFRDPSGFLFSRDDSLYRQVNTTGKEDYDALIETGLYEALVAAGLLIPHREVSNKYAASDQAYKVVKPARIPFVSYPYEWCFGQLRDAALTTLRIQKTALDYGMSLKDCSAYNTQFRAGKPVFIDTLSFEKYREGSPWVAYRQFCQHFLAPLALMRHTDARLNQLFRVYIDGVPLGLASALLPFRTRLRFGLLLHIHVHARSQRHFAARTVDISKGTVRRSSLLGLIDSLQSATSGLHWKPEGTEWADYYTDDHYPSNAFRHKKQIVAQFLTRIDPNTVWDLGANVGAFSRIASQAGIQTISFDADPAAVERNYLECGRRGETNILPLVLDLTNPSPSIGWGHQERLSLAERGPADAVLALALVHHLAISNNVPLDMIARFFHRVCSRSLIVEFVPKRDSQVQRLLSTRQDIFPEYTQPVFEREFGKHFEPQDCVKIADTDRILYLMARRERQT